MDEGYHEGYYWTGLYKCVTRYSGLTCPFFMLIGFESLEPVVSSCNIPTIPLVVAQAMNPAPRPPSPTARDATQKAMRRENPDQLSSRDARVLMGLSGNNEAKEERARLDSFFSNEAMATKHAANQQPPKKAPAPPRPSREMRRSNSVRTMVSFLLFFNRNGSFYLFMAQHRH